jgi:hypothetical protein
MSIMCGPAPIAYELQARFDKREEWITLSVSRTPLDAVRARGGHRDPWGRLPTETRVIAIHGRDWCP